MPRRRINPAHEPSLGIGFERLMYDIPPGEYQSYHRKIRRRSHHPSSLVIGKNIIKVNKIRHSKQGISILCYVEDVAFELMLEHFDIWFLPNASQKIREYFDTLSEARRRTMSRGRLKSLYNYVYHRADWSEPSIDRLSGKQRSLLLKIGSAEVSPMDITTTSASHIPVDTAGPSSSTMLNSPPTSPSTGF